MGVPEWSNGRRLGRRSLVLTKVRILASTFHLFTILLNAIPNNAPPNTNTSKIYQEGLFKIINANASAPNEYVPAEMYVSILF